MIGKVGIQVKPEEIIEAIKNLEKRKRDAFLEDLLAATSSDYLDSIREARADYMAKRVKTHQEISVFSLEFSVFSLRSVV